jgi:ACR3 family arsenite efflux pump ArsB
MVGADYSKSTAIAFTATKQFRMAIAVAIGVLASTADKLLLVL